MGGERSGWRMAGDFSSLTLSCALIEWFCLLHHLFFGSHSLTFSLLNHSSSLMSIFFPLLSLFYPLPSSNFPALSLFLVNGLLWCMEQPNAKSLHLQGLYAIDLDSCANKLHACVTALYYTFKSCKDLRFAMGLIVKKWEVQFNHVICNAWIKVFSAYLISF